MLSCTLPVGVFIDDCSKNLTLMKAVIGGDEVRENSITFFRLKSVFKLTIVQSEGGISAGDTK